MSFEQRNHVREIIKKANIYQNYQRALSQTIDVVESSPLEQALTLSTWLFGTWDGAFILANSLLQGLDTVRLPPECLQASRHRISYEKFQSTTQDTKDSNNRIWSQVLPSLPMSSGDEGFFLITSTLGTLLTGRANMSVRITPSWLRDAGLICPWGATTNGHLLIPVKSLDIRAKQAMAALIAGNHFTNAKESMLTRIPIADGFRWNDIVQNVMDQWRPLVITAFIRVCLDTADDIEGRSAAEAVLKKSVEHLSLVFPASSELLTGCWKLASQAEEKTQDLLKMLEQDLERQFGY